MTLVPNKKKQARSIAIAHKDVCAVLTILLDNNKEMPNSLKVI